MGIECAIVTGTATNESVTASHAWNLMKIDGVWTLTDATWNDLVGTNTGIYAYFNVTDAMLKRNHTTDKVCVRYDLPKCTSLEQNYCVINGCYVKASDNTRQAVTDWAIAYLEKKNTPAIICFEDRTQYKKAQSMLAECFQTAVNQTGIIPSDDSFRYLLVPDANYLQFEE